MLCWCGCKIAQPLWKTVKWNIEVPYGPAIPFLGITPGSWKHVPMQKTAPECLYQHCSQQKVEAMQMSISGWNECINVCMFPSIYTRTHTMEYIYIWIYSPLPIYIHAYIHTVKSNSAVRRATTWMNLENIMLGKRSQTQRVIYYVIPVIWNTQSR